MGKYSVIAATLLLAACSGDDGSAPGSVRSVVVSAPFTSVRVGDAVQVNAVAYDGSGSVVPNATVNWTSSSQNTASVTPSGLVSGLAAGPVTITASVSTASGNLGLTITPNPQGTATVEMPGDIFTPFTTTINVGGTVIFNFPARAHNVIFSRINGAPQDIQPTSNQRVARTFTVAGRYPYDCTLHPPMAGEIVVR